MMTTSQASSPHSVLHPIPLARDRWDDCRGPGSLPEGALAHNPRPVTRRHLQAAAGAARRDTEGIGRPAAAWDSVGARPPHPAGGDAGAASGLGRDVLRSELRL